MEIQYLDLSRQVTMTSADLQCGLVYSQVNRFQGYKEVQDEDPQAADEPSQMLDDEAVFRAPQCR